MMRALKEEMDNFIIIKNWPKFCPKNMLPSEKFAPKTPKK